MFKTRRTKILSAPAEEILEVVVPEPEPLPEPEIKTIYNIDQLSIWDQDEVVATGLLVDSSGKEYKYVWDKKMKRINSLAGEGIDSLIWTLCESVLNKYFVRPEPVKKETPIELTVAEALKVALTPVVSSIKTIENKIATAKPVVQAPAPQSMPMPRPQAVQANTSSESPAISVADDDISANAMRFLQQAQGEDLGIDYMSL